MRRVLEADIGLHDAPVIDDQGIGDDGIDSVRAACAGDLAHAVADHLAAAELDLLAIDGEVLLDLEQSVRCRPGGCGRRSVGPNISA